MKRSHLSISMTVAMCLSGSTLADTVTIPNSFVAGEAAVAADVNANFDAVKSSVDANDGLINTNTTDIATNTSAISQNLTDININISAIDQNAADIDTNSANISSISGALATTQADLFTVRNDLFTGVTAVSGHAFHTASPNNGCVINTSPTSSSFRFETSGSSNCVAVAHIDLPGLAEISDMSCYIYDASGSAGVQFSLLRHKMTDFVLTGSSTADVILQTPDTTADASGLQEVSDFSVTGDATTLSGENAYSIRADFGSTNSVLVSAVGCRVNWYKPNHDPF